MNRFTLALVTTAAILTATSARADTRIGVEFNVVRPPVCRVDTPTVIYAPSPATGYWKDVAVKVLVPARWAVSHDRWGRSIRTFEPAYYTYVTNRVWVEAPSGHPHHGYALEHGGWNK